MKSSIINNSPLVCVRCMTFNHEAYIEDALNGFVIQQTTFPFVVAIINDASTDKTKSVINEFVENNCIHNPEIDLRIEEYGTVLDVTVKDNPHCIFHIVHLNENHYGKKSKLPYFSKYENAAKYVAMCEGDDYWTDPLKLQKQVDFMEANPEYGLCYTDFNFCDEFGNITEESHFKSSQCKPILTFEEHLFSQGYIAPMSWLYRKDVYKSITNDMLQGTSDGTYVLALEFFAKSKVAYLSDTTATYRVHQGSASRPTSLHNFFKYRKSVYDTEKEYVRRYIQNEWILTFIIRQEIYELYPLAYKLGLQDYIEWCHNVSLMNPLIQLYYPHEMIRLEKEIVSARSSKAYRLGKFILAPFKKIKQLFKL